MSEIYESDDEQVEKIKRWWDENGRTTVLGLVIGLSAVFGWTSWQSYQATKAEAASAIYAQLVNAARGDSPEDLKARADTLLAEYPESGYAVLATLYMAKEAATDNRLDEAKARLEWVVQNASMDAYKQVANLRLAQLALDSGDADNASAQLGKLTPPTDDEAAFGASYYALSGDIAHAQGNAEAARKAYEKALNIAGAGTSMGRRLSIKLSDLGTWNIKP